MEVCVGNHDFSELVRTHIQPKIGKYYAPCEKNTGCQTKDTGDSFMTEVLISSRALCHDPIHHTQYH